MNKKRRFELSILKWKKRLKRYGLNPEDGHYYYRSTGKPCSCWFCSPYKYNRAKQKVKNLKLIKEASA